MRKLFFAYLLSLVVISCNSGSSNKPDADKKYFYVEISTNNTFGTPRTKVDTLTIMAKNDSLAYLKAFEKSCVSKKAAALVVSEMKKLGAVDNYETIYKFELLNENLQEVGSDVVSGEALVEIARRISSIKAD